MGKTKYFDMGRNRKEPETIEWIDPSQPAKELLAALEALNKYLFPGSTLKDTPEDEKEEESVYVKNHPKT